MKPDEAPGAGSGSGHEVGSGHEGGSEQEGGSGLSSAGVVREGIETRMRDLGEFIREQRRGARLSLRKLSEQAGISNPYLSQIERGLRKPSAEILQQIAKALRISAETLYVRAGILEERDDEIDLEGEILRDPTIGERHKQTLIEIYRTFQREHAASVREAEDPGGGAVAGETR